MLKVYTHRDGQIFKWLTIKCVKLASRWSAQCIFINNLTLAYWKSLNIGLLWRVSWRNGNLFVRNLFMLSKHFMFGQLIQDEERLTFFLLRLFFIFIFFNWTNKPPDVYHQVCLHFVIFISSKNNYEIIYFRHYQRVILNDIDDQKFFQLL